MPHPLHVKKGEVIIKQGEIGENAFFIREGQVEIVLEKDNGEDFKLGTRGPGTIIGEMGLVDNAERTATVRTTEDCILLQIEKSDFGTRLAKADPILKTVIKVILARYRDLLKRTGNLSSDTGFAGIEDEERMMATENETAETISMTAELRDALEKDQLDLHYQPLIDLKTGEVAGYEALMRWIHPDKGFISPGVFIPVMENSGLITEATQWALKKAADDLDELRKHMKLDGFMSVNFSSLDFLQDEFLEKIDAIMSSVEVGPEAIQIELTERLFMDQPEVAAQILRDCRDKGFVIAIDDFGTGYSSLSYIHNFPIDTLKIDRSFVMDMHENERRQKLARSIIDLGHNLDMKVVAEGAECQEEIDVLKELGCDQVQGYFYCKPLPMEDLIKYLKG